MKFAIVIMLLFTLTANAQKATLNSDSARILIAPMQFTHADTVRALQHLFKKRRTVGSVFVAAAGALAAYGISDVVENGGNAGFFTGASAYILVTAVAAIYTAPLYVPGLVLRGRYSKEKEADLLATYGAKRSLPAKYLRKLKPSLFPPNSPSPYR